MLPSHPCIDGWLRSLLHYRTCADSCTNIAPARPAMEPPLEAYSLSIRTPFIIPHPFFILVSPPPSSSSHRPSPARSTSCWSSRKARLSARRSSRSCMSLTYLDATHASTNTHFLSDHYLYRLQSQSVLHPGNSLRPLTMLRRDSYDPIGRIRL